jgi:PBP superfamily domain/PKD domain
MATASERAMMGGTGRVEPSECSIFGRWVIALMALVALMSTALAPTAGAAAPGQIGKAWGEFGTGKAQFNSPGMFGVDPVDGSVYASDITSGGTRYRLQKLTAEGEFKASVEVPRWLNDKPSEEKVLAMHGIAVDHEKGLLYMVEGCRVASGLGTCRVFGGVGFNARRILVFKTEPEGEKLVPAATPAFTLPIGAEELYEPQAIAVDPSNHDIVLLAEDSAAHLVVQRISSSGVLGARYTDTANALKPIGGNSPASSLAVGPDGTTYTITGGTAPGSKNTRAWQLPPALTSLEAVPGFVAAAEAEGWGRALQATKSNQLFGGPQLAISPDGDTLYWKEKVIASLTSEPGAMLVRGYSLKGKASTALYGGGEKGGICEITTSRAGLATTGERAVVFDFGPEVEEGKKPAYGVKVLTFGPGGSACPLPTAKFQVNKAKVEEVTVTKGDLVSFDASESETGEQALTKLEWSFGDGTTESSVSPEEGKPPVKTISHRYLKVGKYTAKLKLSTLEEGQFPQPAEVIVNVVGGKPTASFTASNANPAPGEAVKFDASASLDPTGGECTQKEGCKSTGKLKTYIWDFGDGAGSETAEPTIEHAFKNSEPTDVHRTVRLIVVSQDNVESSAAEKTITVKGAAKDPVLKLKINGSGASEVAAGKGSLVEFDAGESELFGATPTKVVWEFGDGDKAEKTGKPAALTITHRYLAAGDFAVRVKVAFEGSAKEPQLERTVHSAAGKPTASFTASTTNPAAAEAVEFDASKSFDPTGGSCTQEAGCPGSSTLQTYHWDFGDGNTEDTSTATAVHQFENSGGSTLKRVVSLTVTSFDGVTSDLSQQTIEVKPGSAPFCTGSDILGVGSELQLTAQAEIWGPGFESGTCSGGPKISYGPSGSLFGLQIWNADGTLGAIKTGAQLIGTDGAPDAGEIANVTGVTASAHLLTIPVAQTSITIVANPPAGCTVDEITNQDLDQVFRGNHAKWSRIASAEGSCESPITRVVRSDASPITTQFKHYLYLVNANPLACTFGGGGPGGKATWQELEPIGEGGAPNTNWPQACEEQKFIGPVVAAGKSGDGAVVNAVNATDGSIGYATTPEVKAHEVPGTTVSVALQNNGWKKLSEATFAPPAVGTEANCSDAYYIVPPEGRRMPTGSGLDVDWSQVFGGRPGSGGLGYSLCMLTYDLAFHGYQAAGFTFKNYKTVHDYLREHVVAQAGQEALTTIGGYYSPVPASGLANKDVLGAARYAAGKITW